MKDKNLPGNSWIAIFAIVDQIKRLRSFGRRVQFKLGRAKYDGFNDSAPVTIPKKIWMYWDNDFENAPPIVKLCVDSWKKKNPDWDVVVLNEDTVSQYVEFPELSSGITVQAFSDLLRLRLLNQYGGVWVDATSYCVKPLEHWLPVVAQSGFFAFVWTPDSKWFMWPSYFREIASWFLAATPGNPIISEWEKYSFDYWRDRTETRQYFWLHTLFETLSYASPQFRRALRRVPTISSFGPHLVHDSVFRDRDLDQVAELLEQGVAPVQKLRWNWSGEKLGTVSKLLHEDF